MPEMSVLTDSDFANFVKNNDVVLVDFYADWCGPCHMIKPVIEELSREMEGKVKFGKVDVDRNKEKAIEYGIMSIPTLLIFKNGKLVDRLTGAMPKEAIKERIEKFLD